MAAKLTETRHLYSWWWDSHISPKNSKWLQENLTDTDGKVKAMIKIINEDADSFAKRAEMYYKKRPELMKLVEDFYRAYRALAERYDHATGELRLAHRTMIEAFPNQMPYMLNDEPNLGENGLKQIHEMFQSGESTLRELKTAEFRLRANNSQGDEESKDSSSKLDLRTMIINESERAVKVEAEMQRLKLALAKMEGERDSALSQYNQISEKLLNLEKEAEKISAMEEKLEASERNAEVLCKQNLEAESEIKALKEEISRLNKEKEDAYLRYQQCLEVISKLQNELMEAKEELRRLKSAENQYVLLEEVNQSLKIEANEKDQKLLEKHNELEVLMTRLEDEEARFVQAEAELSLLQDMHFKSQKDMEMEIEGLKMASCAVQKDMELEILGLKEIKERLEIEVKRQEEKNEVLQQQLKSSGIDSNCIKDLQDENLRLKQRSDERNAEKEALLKRLCDVNFELESSKEKMKAFQDLCSTLGGEKSSLIAEKSALLSQLQIITESMQKLLEKNVSLETSLHSANIELEGLKVKSKGLEDFVQFLKDEKSSLQAERSNLVYRLEFVEKKLERLETRFTKLENKYFDLEKARDLARDQVQELKISLACETRLSGLENRVLQLQEESCEEQVEKDVSAQVEIFMLKKFMKDMEERDCNLLAECHKHLDAAKFSEKLISELENENMMQHLEIEYLLDRVENLRIGICQVLKALEIDHVKNDPEILLCGNIEEFKRKISESKDENQELLIQNNVLSAVIKEMSSEVLKSDLFLHEKLTELEEDNSKAILETLSLSNQCLVFKSSWIQTVMELGNVAEAMCNLKEDYRDLGEKLVIRETENVQLKELIRRLEETKMELNVRNDKLNKKCSVEKLQCKTQEKEIVLLRETNGSLENEVSALTQEIESCKTRELFLNSELHEISSEFELWEAEATSFYFDLHISSVREALLEDKVEELSGLYGDLQNVDARKTMEIEKLNNRISFLESDREELKSNLAALLPAIASLKDNIASLEQTQTKACCHSTPQLQDAKEQDCSVSDGLSELQDLQKRIKAIKNSVQDSIQSNIKMVKQKSRNNSQVNATVQSRSRELGPGTSEPRNGIHMKDIPLDHVSASPTTIRRRKSSRLSDQMLELWEASDMDSSNSLSLYKTQPRSSPPRRKRSDSNAGEIEKELGVDKLELSKNVTTESKQGGNRKIILERLTSDAKKLATLQNSVQELKTKMETNKKSKAARHIEFKSLKSQIYNVESSVMQLVSMNTELTKTVKGNPKSSLDFARSRELIEVEQALRRKMLEQTRRDSERIGSLQQEMEKMQSMVVKMEDEKKNDVIKGAKNGLMRTRTGIILREFVYGRSRSRKQKKKQRFCGCFKQSHKEV
ncbi:hypothetical protein V2J09_014218 [Rumex salicifolius]